MTKGYWPRFTIPEKYSLAILLLYLLLAVVYYSSFESPVHFIMLNIGMLIYIGFIAYAERFFKSDKYTLFRNISLIAALYIIYSQIFSIIDFVNPNLVDSSLIAIDHWLIGTDITTIASQFTHPLLTELLQIAYFLFFVAMLSQGILLYTRDTTTDFDFFIRNIIFGFYLSYIGYILFPAIGPRFTIGDFSTISEQLPGLWLTEPIRTLINGAGNIGNPLTAALDVNKDCMPSGHTMMTVINLWMAYRLKLKIRHVILVISFLIIFSTLYLQYHYLIDVIAGIICAFLSLSLEPLFAKMISTKKTSNTN